MASSAKGCLQETGGGKHQLPRTTSNLREVLRQKLILVQKVRCSNPATRRELLLQASLTTSAVCELDQFAVTVRVPDEQLDIHILADERTTVKRVKEILRNVTGMVSKDQVLLFGETTLFDRTTLCEAGVVGGSTLHLMFSFAAGGLFDAVTPATDPSTLEDGEHGKKTPSDVPEHCAFVSKEFEYQSCIEKCEHRAMTLRNLKAVNGFATAHCGDWKDVSTYKDSHGVWVKGSPKFGEIPSMEWLNLYVMNMWVIMPGCKAKNCSFVELVASEEQPPKWFCSHWWGERVIDFEASLSLHVHTYKYTEDTTYWVCAYANRQWAIAGEGISVDPKETPFYKAMHVAKSMKGGTLVVLDKDAVAFTRIWCAFEESITLNEELKIDISTCLEGKAYLITDQPCEQGVDAGTAHSSSADLKMTRELDFPLAVIKIGLGLELEHASASVDTDRKHILNSISRRPVAEFNDEPPKANPLYEEVNAQLRSTFAISALRQIIDAGEDDNMKLYDVIAADTWRTHLECSFSYDEHITDHKVMQLANALSPNLRELTLQLSYTNITDEAVIAIMPKLPKSITFLQFHLNGCHAVTDKGVEALADGLHELEHMTHLKLGLQSNTWLTDAPIVSIANKLGTKKGSGMIWFWMNFKGDDKLTDASAGALLDHLPATMTGFGLWNPPHWSAAVTARINDTWHKMQHK